VAASQRLGRIFLTGLLILLPAWTTFLILIALFNTLDSFLLDLVGHQMQPYAPGLGVLLLVGMVFTVGAIATHVIGQRLVLWTETVLERIPLIRSIYLTLKSMTDLLNYKARFGKSTVVAFPFPSDGLWALGLVMGAPPQALQIAPMTELVMVFVPTAIHPFTGYLAMIPKTQLHPLSLLPEEALKLEFTAGLYRPLPGWLSSPTGEPS
jgi:uncharacterized membrane protein